LDFRLSSSFDFGIRVQPSTLGARRKALPGADRAHNLAFSHDAGAELDSRVGEVAKVSLSGRSCQVSGLACHHDGTVIVSLAYHHDRTVIVSLRCHHDGTVMVSRACHHDGTVIVSGGRRQPNEVERSHDPQERH